MFLHSKESRQTLQFAEKIRRRVSVVERMVWWTLKQPFVRLLAVVAGDTPHTSHPGNSYTFLSSLLWILSSSVILCGTSWHFCTLVGGTGEGGGTTWEPRGPPSPSMSAPDRRRLLSKSMDMHLAVIWQTSKRPSLHVNTWSNHNFAEKSG